ncbi:MAG: endonuclease/exonuclease/phosphatase family protein [Marinilabilia sp.]
MRKAIFTILLALIGLVSCGNQNSYFEIISFNVRFNNPDDAPNDWENRKSMVSEYFSEKTPEIIGMQEVLPEQLEDLSAMLENYDYLSAGRENGEDKGEACPVFYRKDMFEYLDGGYFWLSETPEEAGSMSWGTDFPRIVTWVKLKSVETGYAFFVFNTHFSHMSEEARSKSATLLLEQIDEIAGSTPVALTGDFNTTRDTETYQTLVGGGDERAQMWDAEELADETRKGEITFNGFDPDFDGSRIDFVFVNEFFDVDFHSVDEVREDEVFISDHYPVRAKITFRPDSRKKRDPQ